MRFKVEKMGDDVEGFRIIGDKKKPEPEAGRIVFPGGWVEVRRCKDSGDEPEYWVHIGVNHPEATCFNPVDMAAKLSDGRLDISDKHTKEVDKGEIDNENLYHLAICVKPDWKGELV